MLNVESIKKDFPIFANNPGLVYLDSAATSLKPKSAIDKLTEYYEKYSANIARGVYKMADKATEEYESTREITAKFINARDADEIIFTRNSTEGLNLISYSLGRELISKGDGVVTTVMEHHSNFVPWQILAFENGADFKVIDIDEKGKLVHLEFWDKIINRKTKLLAITYISNVLGTINPISKIVETVKRINPNIIVVVDAAQAAPHIRLDVQDLGCDFLVFSGHKMLGPTGVGVLWGKSELLENMFPFQYGGGMVSEVTIEKTVFKPVPCKFEAGTPDIAGVIALKEAIKYLENIGFDNMRLHEKEITEYAIISLQNIFADKIRIFGPTDTNEHTGIISFTFGGLHSHDVAQILDEENIAVRAGLHCAMPLHTRLNIDGSTRASFHIYNSKEDVDKLVEGLKKVEKILK